MARRHGYGLLLIGDSITHNLESPEFEPASKQFYAPRNALVLGYAHEDLAAHRNEIVVSNKAGCPMRVTRARSNTPLTKRKRNS